LEGIERKTSVQALKSQPESIAGGQRVGVRNGRARSLGKGSRKTPTTQATAKPADGKVLSGKGPSRTTTPLLRGVRKSRSNWAEGLRSYKVVEGGTLSAQRIDVEHLVRGSLRRHPRCGNELANRMGVFAATPGVGEEKRTEKAVPGALPPSRAVGLKVWWGLESGEDCN